MSVYELLDSNVVVLTASRRLAHALRVGYAHRARELGLSVWRTPTVLPWTTWLREQWREERARDTDESALLLSGAQTRVIWQEVVESSSFGAGLLNPSNAARLAARSWARMQEHRIALGDLAGSEEPEAQALHEWCTAFLHRCEELNALDEARLLDWALQQPLIPAQSLALAGFDFIPPALAQLAALWKQHGRFAEIDSGSGQAEQISVYGAADSDAELEAAARWSRARLEQGDGSVGVLIAGLQSRRTQVQRVFENVFAPGARVIGSDPRDASVVIAAPQPLADYPMVDAAILVLSFAAGRGDSLLAGRLLRSPFIVAGEAERDVRALADFRLREERRECKDWFELERWAGSSGATQLMLSARAINALLREAPASLPPSRRAEQFHAILRAAGWPGDRTLTSIEQQTLHKFQEALAQLGSLDVLTARVTLRDAVTQLGGLLRDTPFEPETPAGAVTVIDPSTAAGMQFDALWVMGLDAARLPGAANPDPLLPLSLQLAAGIPEASAAATLQLAQTQFERWLTSAQHVVFSWPRREGDAELEPSPLLSRWTPASPESVARSTVRSLRETLFEGRPTLERLLDTRAPALGPHAARGGAMTLELQSRCPFRAQAELRLHAKAPPSPGVGVDPRQRGEILHRTLADLWGALGDQAALAATTEQELQTQVRAIAERQTAHVLRAVTQQSARLAALEVENVVGLVMRLLASERARPYFRLRRAESAQSHRIAGLEITLRPDRVDELSNGGALLIDYKLGDSHRTRDWLEAWPGRPRRPQLPLYALAYGEELRALAYVVLAPGAVEYRGWSDGVEVGAGVRPFPQGVRPRNGAALPEDWNALLAHWRAMLSGLAEQYFSGESRVDPLPQECAICHLSALCRINEQLRPDSNGEEGEDGERS